MYSTGKTRMFFDIESYANAAACALMPEPEIEAPANYKDPDAIARYKAEKTAQKQAEMVERAALDPDLARVASIGLSTGGDVTVFVNEDLYRPAKAGWTPPADVMSEKGLLMLFWKFLSDCDGRCVGYNIISFDLPFLLRRSMALDVDVPFAPNLAKYRTEPVTDLFGILYNWGPGKSLKTVAKLYQLPVKCEGVDGSMVAQLNPEELRKYQTSDVELVKALWARMNGKYFCQ